MRYRVVAGTIITMDDNRNIYQPGQLTWEDDRIVSVGALDSDVSAVDKTIHAPEQIVLPGFYNGHNHAAMTLFRGMADDSPLFEWLEQHVWPREAHLTADDIYAGTLLAAAEMIRSGTVGFADMYFEVDAVARAVVDSGLRGWIARGLIGAQDTSGKNLEQSIAFAERWRGQAKGRVIPMLGPHAPYTCPPEYLADVARAAQQYDLGIHIHLSESLQEMEQIRNQYGVSPIQLAADAGIFDNRTLIAHGVHIGPEDLPYLQGLRGGVVSCPISNAKLGNGIMPYGLLADAGVKVGLGTDGAASTNTLDMFAEMKAMSWFQKLRMGRPDAFHAYQALYAATRGSAQILGFDGGFLNAGHPADWIMVDTNRPHLTPDWDPVANVVYAATGADVTYTVVDGVILMMDGIITAFDEPAIINDIKQRHNRIQNN